MMATPKQFDFTPFNGRTIDGHHTKKDQKGIEAAKEPAKEFTAEDLENAKTQSHSQGHAEGLTAGMEQGKTELFQLQQQINQRIEVAFSQLEPQLDYLKNELENKRQMATKLSAMIAKKVSGDVLVENADEKVKKYIEKSLPLVFAEKSIIVTVHSDICESIKQSTSALAKEQEHKGQIEFVTKDGVPETFCQIEWGSGGMENNPDHTWQEINKILGIAEEENSQAQRSDDQIETEKPEVSPTETPIEKEAAPAKESDESGETKT